MTRTTRVSTVLAITMDHYRARPGSRPLGFKPRRPFFFSVRFKAFDAPPTGSSDGVKHIFSSYPRVFQVCSALLTVAACSAAVRASQPSEQGKSPSPVDGPQTQSSLLASLLARYWKSSSGSPHTAGMSTASLPASARTAATHSAYRDVASPTASTVTNGAFAAGLKSVPKHPIGGSASGQTYRYAARTFVSPYY